MSKSTHASSVPRAVIHKRILSAAAEAPDASIERLASTTPGATADLVERVLDTYGDPAGSDSVDTAMATNTRIDPDDLTEVQLETLASIYEDPEATQAALADRLGVADATINQRLSTIDGFEWERRETLVSNLFEGSDLELDAGTGRDQEPVTGGPVDVEEVESRLADLVDERTAEFSTRLRDVERSIDERLDGGDGRDADRLDDALLTKVVRACVTDDSITEEEERRIIEYLR